MPGDQWPVATPVPLALARVRGRAAQLRRRRRVRRAVVPAVAFLVLAALVTSTVADGHDARVRTMPADRGRSEVDVSPPVDPAPPEAEEVAAASPEPVEETAGEAVQLPSVTTVPTVVPAPSEGRIAFVRDEAIWVMEADGSGAAPITDGSAHNLSAPDWRPDGKALVATEALRSRSASDEPRWRLVLVTLDGAVRPLTNFTVQTLHAKWSPDGARLAYSDGGLWVVDVESASAKRIVETGASAPTWSPDGTELAYQCHSSSLGQTAICIVGVDGGVPRVVPNSVSLLTPSWSSDGRLVVVRVHNGYDLLTIAPDGTDEQVVANFQFAPRMIEWSPGGESLVFVMPDETVKTCAGISCTAALRIWRIEADGSRLRPLTDGPSDAGPQWSSLPAQP